MSRLLKGSELLGRVVVTFGGDDVCEVKDVIYTADGAVAGFTLNNRGIFAGPRKAVLHTEDVHWMGPDALMVADEGALSTPDEQVGRRAIRSEGSVLGSDVLTDAGRRLGSVTDVIIAADAAGDVVGYEIEADEGFRPGGPRVFVPLPDTLAAGGENLVVPARAEEFVADDLAGFSTLVRQFRSGEGRNEQEVQA